MPQHLSALPSWIIKRPPSNIYNFTDRHITFRKLPAILSVKKSSLMCRGNTNLTCQSFHHERECKFRPRWLQQVTNRPHFVANQMMSDGRGGETRRWKWADVSLEAGSGLIFRESGRPKLMSAWLEDESADSGERREQTRWPLLQDISLERREKKRRQRNREALQRFTASSPSDVIEAEVNRRMLCLNTFHHGCRCTLKRSPCFPLPLGAHHANLTQRGKG